MASVALRGRGEGEGKGEGGGSTMDDPAAQKMIVCHDMMGGYVKDKFVQGIRCVRHFHTNLPHNFYHSGTPKQKTVSFVKSLVTLGVQRSCIMAEFT